MVSGHFLSISEVKDNSVSRMDVVIKMPCKFQAIHHFYITIRLSWVWSVYKATVAPHCHPVDTLSNGHSNVEDQRSVGKEIQRNQKGPVNFTLYIQK